MKMSNIFKYYHQVFLLENVVSEATNNILAAQASKVNRNLLTALGATLQGSACWARGQPALGADAPTR